ncbi:hypothetical protein Goklo_001934 [Gossypium klotzschianum]|uniref:Mitochondrial fission 1 protein n=1 Tax=Gossypium klotzschianum TaxID=34286 RepID=A0A7J8W1Z3_9ROSI|nr:hypothetical protein [Gossypium klotzschianum]
MEAKVGKFFDSVTNFFSGSDQLPWCDADIIAVSKDADLGILATAIPIEGCSIFGDPTLNALALYTLVKTIYIDLILLLFCLENHSQGCEKEAAEANGSDESKNECLTRFSWALVHSRRTEDVERGIAMLEASIASTTDPLKMREKLYLLAVGHFRRGDYSRSRELVEQCLMVEPEWRQAQSLKKAIEDRITKGNSAFMFGV